METKKNFNENFDKLYDAIIVGAGPAGLSAAIYMARAKYKVLVIEKEKIGGQITITSDVVNYPGVEKTSGSQLTETMRVQATHFGAEFLTAEVGDMSLEEDIKVLQTSKGEYRALGVILAPGANPRKLGFEGEQEFQGRGVAYCATCDGEFFDGLEVFVIGGGFAAIEEGIFLTKYASKVTMIVRKDSFSAAKTVVDQLQKYKNIEVKFNTEIVEASGDGMISHAKFRNNKTGQLWEHGAVDGEPFGIFVFSGYVPNTGWIANAVDRDNQGYLITDTNQKTNLDGVYGAGDVCVKNLRQVVTAVSDGAIAATSLEKYLGEIHQKLNIPDLEINTISTDADREKKIEKKEENVNKAGNAGTEQIETDGFLSQEIRGQLTGVFAKFTKKIKLRLWLDHSDFAKEILGFTKELVNFTDKILWEEKNAILSPSIEICSETGESAGIHFHAVPGGHEFTSFIMAICAVAGVGQGLEAEEEKALGKIAKETNIKVITTLSCTMCPELVMATQKIAANSEKVIAEMFDLSKYPEIKSKYKIMSVPAMIINDDKVYFGKKNVAEVMKILTEEQ